ncbi:hypothetical protein G5I_11648 [Acromyrmex echinatior]|uniref:Uncharacterized protein n=1 Tax=Acromyrmex echinatior TaxID=103372 RepID=F4X060_ACREC|nr:hypothetical protein G5I_11648 [Acromyrmex echinatior]
MVQTKFAGFREIYLMVTLNLTLRSTLSITQGQSTVLQIKSQIILQLDQQFNLANNVSKEKSMLEFIKHIQCNLFKTDDEICKTIEETQETLEGERENEREKEEEEEDEEEEGGYYAYDVEVGEQFNFLELTGGKLATFQKFWHSRKRGKFRDTPIPEGANIVRWLENAFREIYAYAINLCEPIDYVGISFDSTNLAHGPAGLSLHPVRDFTSEDIWGLVSSVAQSVGRIDIAENFDVRIFNIAVPVGRGRKLNSLMHEDVAKRSILQLNNSDNLCFPRSLIVA